MGSTGDSSGYHTVLPDTATAPPRRRQEGTPRMVGVRLIRLSWRPLGATHRGPRKENNMAEYELRTQDDYDNLPHGSITFSDDVYTYGDITMDDRADKWDIHMEAGHLTLPSSCDVWLTLNGGRLDLVWDGEDSTLIYNAKDVSRLVRLIGEWPKEHAREDKPDKKIYYDVAESARENNPTTATVTWEDGRTETEEIIGEVKIRPVDEVASPVHYTWIGRAITRAGGPERTEDLESWDILDALFPDDPHLWNAGKYLTRLGRKGSEVRRIVDLRKARTYLDRAIRREERDA